MLKNFDIYNLEIGEEIVLGTDLGNKRTLERVDNDAYILSWENKYKLYIGGELIVEADYIRYEGSGYFVYTKYGVEYLAKNSFDNVLCRADRVHFDIGNGCIKICQESTCYLFVDGVCVAKGDSLESFPNKQFSDFK